MGLFSRLGAFRRCRRGSNAVEFAFVAPLLFATVLGAFEIGRMAYERNVLYAAAAEGSRAVLLYGAADETSIKNVINAKMSRLDTSNITIVLTDEVMGTANFKKIEITYDFDFLVKVSHSWSGLTFTATRYAPAMS